jgi:hypothetical protein
MPRRPLIAALVLAVAGTWTIATLPASRPAARDAPRPAHAALHATPATLARVFEQAGAGDAIVLSAGDYGTFRGGMKPGRVVLEAAPGAAVRMAVRFSPAANITLDHLEIAGLEIGDARSHDLTVRNSRFERSQAVIRTGELSEAKVVLERNVHAGFDKCASCYEGRVELTGRTDRPSGVTIRDSAFLGGNSDGIQNGGSGVRILGNTFTGIHQVDGADGVHADAIQLYGSRGTVIRGNRMRDVATGIMAPDGTDHELIEHNVIETDGYPFAIMLGGDRDSVVRGNHLHGGACHYGLRCGTLQIRADKAGAGSRGTVVEDNVLGALAVDAASRLAVDRGNVVTG